MKTLNLIKEYGGIDALIEEVETWKKVNDEHDGQIWDYDILECILYALKDYKRLIKRNKKLKQKVIDDSWPDALKIGDRQEMGG